MAARHRNRRRRRGRASFPLRLLGLAVVLAAVVGAVTMFFRINVMIVEGNERYTDEQIIAAAGVQPGDNLVLLNKYSVKQAVFDQLPYVETVAISRKYPDALILSVTECTAAAALPGGGGMWWLMSSGGKLLEETSQPAGVVKASGCTLDAPAPGGAAAFAQDDSYKLERLLALLREAEDKRLLEYIDALELSDGAQITFTYQQRFTVKLPWDADMDRSLRALQKVVDERLESNETGEINLMNLMTEGRAYFIPSK